jgi:hypothetical protein
MNGGQLQVGFLGRPRAFPYGPVDFRTFRSWTPRTWKYSIGRAVPPVLLADLDLMSAPLSL